MLSVLKNYFSFSGRMNRITYIKTAIILVALWMLTHSVMFPVYESVHRDVFLMYRGILGAELPKAEELAELIVLADSLYFRSIYLMGFVTEVISLLMLPAFVKRLHDTGMTGKMTIFIYFPTVVWVTGLITNAKIVEYNSFMISFASLFLMSMLAFRKGDEGENKYGKHPNTGKGELL